MPNILLELLLKKKASGGRVLEEYTLPAFALGSLQALLCAQVCALIGITTPGVLFSTPCLALTVEALESMDRTDFGADYMRLTFPA